MNYKELKREYDSLKKSILEIGLPIPGTVHKLYARCGAKTCPCANDDSKRHGPYYRWHYRKGNRQCTVGIEKEKLEILFNAINNREKLEKLLDKMMKIGIQYIENELDSSVQKSTTDNSKKP